MQRRTSARNRNPGQTNTNEITQEQRPQLSPSATKKTGNAGRSKQNQISSTSSGERERVTYVAKEPTPRHIFFQTSQCRNYQNKFKKAFSHLQCQNCADRQCVAGGCMFNGLRAWRVKEEAAHEDDAAPKDEGTAEDGNNSLETKTEEKENETPQLEISKKRKAADEVSQPNSKVQKTGKGGGGGGGGGDKINPESIDFEDFCLVGNLRTENTLNGNTLNGSEGIKRTYSESERQDASYILSKIAPSFRRVLKHEREHEKQKPVKKRPVSLKEEEDIEETFRPPVVRIISQPGQRSLCDACAASVFLVNYICVVCGKEYCPNCYDEWDPEVECLRFDLCSRRRRHGKEQMALLVRAAKGEIQSMLEDVERWIEAHPEANGEQQPADNSEGKFKLDDSHGESFLPVPWANVDGLNEVAFRELWSPGGRPLVLSDCLPHFSLEWSPSFFKERYGHEKCYLHDCGDPMGIYKATVEKYFDGFDESRFETKQGVKHLSLKLKDWPPADDFAFAFPELFNDFENALPWRGRYMKRDGWMNVASWLPQYWNKPDLGPKMYNAYPAPGEGLVAKKAASSEADPVKEEDIYLGDGAAGGTTNLHLDITDAVNFMVYASGPVPKIRKPNSGAEDDDSQSPSSNCSAVWDIFPPSAATGIRDYLSAKNPLIDDPIHRQTFYLSDEDLSKLREGPYNVRAYRIFQNPGDAVIIPAGCPHQVRNVRSCIKVAVDFLSSENVHVCEGLLQEGRNLAKSGKGGLPIEGTGKALPTNDGKREDVLQLWNCLRFAWKTMSDVVTEETKMEAGANTEKVETAHGMEEGKKETMTVSGMNEKKLGREINQ